MKAIANASANNTSASQIVSVQYLRGIAASSVAIFHIGLIFGTRLHLGEAGVDMFFVISGFIMWLVTREREATASIFIKKRIVRIVPLYWCATFALAFCASIKPNLFPGVSPTTSHLIQSLLFIPQIAPDGSMFPLLVQGWTLNYEMFFYAMFALTLFLRGSRQIYCLSTIMLCLVIVGSLGESESPVLRTYTSPMLLEFLAGLWIGWLWTHDTLLNRRNAWTCLALGTITLIAGGIIPLGLSRVICAGLPSAAIILGAISLERSGWVPSIASLKVLGDASYSIYLTHSLTQNAASILFAKYHIAINAYSYVFTVMAALIVGVVTYRMVENSLTGWLRRSDRLPQEIQAVRKLLSLFRVKISAAPLFSAKQKIKRGKRAVMSERYPWHPSQEVLPTTKVDVRFKRHNKFLRNMSASSINWQSDDILSYRLATDSESEWILVRSAL